MNIQTPLLGYCLCAFHPGSHMSDSLLETHWECAPSTKPSFIPDQMNSYPSRIPQQFPIYLLSQCALIYKVATKCRNTDETIFYHVLQYKTIKHLLCIRLCFQTLWTPCRHKISCISHVFCFPRSEVAYDLSIFPPCLVQKRHSVNKPQI